MIVMATQLPLVSLVTNITVTTTAMALKILVLIPTTVVTLQVSQITANINLISILVMPEILQVSTMIMD
ncbi:MAG: hypothetical protein EXX96DRAFT_564684 [Benjaminiella poitrasii]|nr:MAG: hypothetical protein EXX96DRAFT_564684 [Benjaminiella poitrasii]